MQDLIQQLLNYARGMWRFRWYAIILAWVVAIAGWIFVFQMPDQYKASGRVFVDTQSILRPLLRGLAVQTDASQRVRLMTQTLLSRPNLEKVARMTDLDISAKTPEDMEALLDELASNIRLSSTRQEQNLYTISYETDEPQVAKNIVQSILTIFVESSLGEVRKDSNVAQKFLEQQIKEYEAKLIEAENRLTEFKRANVGFLPGQGGDIFSRLQTAQEELSQAKLTQREARQRREEMKRQVEDAEDSEEGLLFSGANATLTSSVDGRITSLETRLDTLLLQYTENHPDVKEIRQTIAALEVKKKQELEEKSAEMASSGANANPLRQQLELSLSQASANYAASGVRVREYERRVNKLKELVDTLPKVETEIKRLDRDYEVNKQNYNRLLASRESAEMSEDVEQTGDNVKFKIIDPPRVPLSPSGPNRPLFSSIALLLGLAVGIGLAFVLSQIRPVFFDRRTLRQVAGYPVFGAVSRVMTPEVLFKRRLEFGAFISATIVLVLAYGGVLMLQSVVIGGPGQLLESLRSAL